MKLSKYITGLFLATAILSGCTDLDETLYDQVGTQNYYNTKMDVIRATFRPFEHAFWSIQSRHVLNELTADQLITPTRDGWWDDGGKWRRLHYHTWTVEDGDAQTEWNGCFQGIMQANYVIEDLNTLSAETFGFTSEEFNNLKAQCHVLRAWFYLRLLDAFRNIPLAVSFNNVSLNSEGQVAPRAIFEFIEKELNENIGLLVQKEKPGGNGSIQGQWTKAGAAALLVRLYLNAEKYVGEDRYADCENIAQKIVDGEYGFYKLADSWDAPFDWNNETCDEVIFAFPSSPGYSYWHYQGDTYWWTVPSQAHYYFNDTKAKAGGHNCKYACSPSYDLNGNKYDFSLGMTVEKFRKYPGDVRLKLYKNLGENRREGLFLFGTLDFQNENGETEKVKSPNGDYALCIRDAVGQFKGLPEGQYPQNKVSNLQSGDHNSGWHFCKYPFYSDTDTEQMESDFVEIRLAEIVYSLAECKFRQGDVEGAARLLNQVRKRNYSQENLADNLYTPDGKAQLTENELLDEWGREFFAESRRRIDLIRFGKFNSGTWWDKSADADNHTEIFAITREVLNANHHLVQNPGYGK